MYTLLAPGPGPMAQPLCENERIRRPFVGGYPESLPRRTTSLRARRGGPRASQPSDLSILPVGYGHPALFREGILALPPGKDPPWARNWPQKNQETRYRKHSCTRREILARAGIPAFSPPQGPEPPFNTFPSEAQCRSLPAVYGRGCPVVRLFLARRRPRASGFTERRADSSEARVSRARTRARPAGRIGWPLCADAGS